MRLAVAPDLQFAPDRRRRGRAAPRGQAGRVAPAGRRAPPRCAPFPTPPRRVPRKTRTRTTPSKPRMVRVGAPRPRCPRATGRSDEDAAAGAAAAVHSEPASAARSPAGRHAHLQAGVVEEAVDGQHAHVAQQLARAARPPRARAAGFRTTLRAPRRSAAAVTAARRSPEPGRRAAWTCPSTPTACTATSRCAGGSEGTRQPDRYSDVALSNDRPTGSRHRADVRPSGRVLPAALGPAWDPLRRRLRPASMPPCPVQQQRVRTRPAGRWFGSGQMVPIPGRKDRSRPGRSSRDVAARPLSDVPPGGR